MTSRLCVALAWALTLSACLDFEAAEEACFARGACRTVTLDLWVRRFTSAGIGEPQRETDLPLELVTRRPFEVGQARRGAATGSSITFNGINPGRWWLRTDKSRCLVDDSDAPRVDLDVVGLADAGAPEAVFSVRATAPGARSSVFAVVPDQRIGTALAVDDAGVALLSAAPNGDEAWLLALDDNPQPNAPEVRTRSVARFSQQRLPVGDQGPTFETSYQPPTRRTFQLRWPVGELSALAPLVHPEARANRVEFEVIATPFTAGPARRPEVPLLLGDVQAGTSQLRADLRYADPFDAGWARWVRARHLFTLSTPSGVFVTALEQVEPLSPMTTLRSAMHPPLDATIEGRPFAEPQRLERRSPVVSWRWSGNEGVLFRLDVLRPGSLEPAATLWTSKTEVQLLPEHLVRSSNAQDVVVFCLSAIVTPEGAPLTAAQASMGVKGAWHSFPVLSGRLEIPAVLADAAP